MRPTNVAVTLLIVFLSLNCDPASALGAVVYDSLPFTAGGVGFATSSEVGQSVSLGGDARVITQIDVALGAGGPGGFYVHLYELDEENGRPDSLIWSSTLQSYPFESLHYNYKVLSVDVPNLVVPSKFAWSVASADVVSNMIVLSSSLPTVGTSHQQWVRSLSGEWGMYSINEGVYGARFLAIPEPPSVLLSVVCAAAWNRRRLRRGNR